MAKIIRENKGFSSLEMELMFLLALIAIIGLISMPIYKKYILKPKAKKALQVISEIISFISSPESEELSIVPKE